LATIFLLSVAYAYWILFADGIKIVRELQFIGIYLGNSQHTTSETVIKIFAALGPPLVAVWVLLISSMGMPIPVH